MTIEEEKADRMLVRMDRALCDFLNESADFTFTKKDARCHFAVMMNLLTLKAGDVASCLFLTGQMDADVIRTLLTDLVVSSFDRALIRAGDNLVWKPEGSA